MAETRPAKAERRVSRVWREVLYRIWEGGLVGGLV